MADELKSIADELKELAASADKAKAASDGLAASSGKAATAINGETAAIKALGAISGPLTYGSKGAVRPIPTAFSTPLATEFENPIINEGSPTTAKDLENKTRIIKMMGKEAGLTADQIKQLTNILKRLTEAGDLEAAYKKQSSALSIMIGKQKEVSAAKEANRNAIKNEAAQREIELRGMREEIQLRSKVLEIDKQMYANNIGRATTANENRILNDLLAKTANISTNARLREAIDSRQAALSQRYAQPLGAIQQRLAEQRAIDTLPGGVLNPGQVQSLAGSARYGNVYNRIKSFTPEGVEPKIRIREEESSGIGRVTASYRDMNGILHELNTTIGRHGELLTDTQRRFRTFGDALTRDIVEVAKWSIAIAVVYGPLRKLQELVKEAISNQENLADVTVAMGKAQKDITGIFEAAVEIAQQTGEALSGVIEGYALAYRATGNIKDSFERATVANKLMTDSLVLSKLAEIDQATALDTLTASLRQTGMSLTSGSELLDKWVKTSQVANIDLNTLATSFAVVGDAAENAGITVDQLNGIVAAIGETGVTAGREAANTARALIAGFQSDQSKKILSEFGIAVEDTTGKMRPFLDIMKELSDLVKAGIISKGDLSAITLALGGGTRRQAAYATFIENFSRVNEIAAESATANGEAQAALSIKLDTVQTSATKLGNAFSSWAQSMGGKGGVLDIIQAMNEGLTFLVGNISKLTGVLGKSSLMLEFLGVLALIKGIQKIRLSDQPVADLLTKINPQKYGQPRQEDYWIQRINNGQTAGITQGERAQQSFNAIWKGGLQGAILGMLPSVIAAGGNALQGNTERAKYELAGGAIGTALGFVLGGGSPITMMIGGAVGTSIGDGLLSYLEGKKYDFNKLGEQIIIPGSGTQPLTESAKKEYIATISATAQKIMESPAAGETSYRQRRHLVVPKERGDFELPKEESMKILQEIYGTDFVTDVIGENDEYFTKLIYLRRNKPELFTPEEIRKIDEMYQHLLSEENKVITGTESTAMVASMKAFGENYGSLLATLVEKANQEALSNLGEGKLTVAEQRRAAANLVGFKGSQAAKWYAGFQMGGQMGGETPVESLTKMGNVSAYAPEEISQYITNLVGMADQEKQTYETAVKISSELGIHSGALAAIIIATQDWNSNLTLAWDMLQNTNKELEKAKTGLSVIDLSELTPEGQAALIADVNKRAVAFITAQQEAGGYSKETADVKKNDYVKVLVQMADGTYQWVMMLAEANQFINDAQQEQVKLGRVSNQEVGIEQMGYTKAQIDSALSMYPSMLKYIQSLASGQGWQFNEKLEPQIVKTEDGQFMAFSKDNRIMQLLLSQIADNTAKQLEGIYNLPEGASFWFPNSVIPSLQASASNSSLNTSNLPGIIAEGITKAGAGDGALGKTVKANGVEYPAGMPAWLASYAQAHNVGSGIPLNSLGDPSAFTKLSGLNKTYLPMFKYSTRETGYTGSSLGGGGFPSFQFKLNLTSNTQLIVDGRTLANVIKPYLRDDMINSNGTTTTATLNQVI